MSKLSPPLRAYLIAVPLLGAALLAWLTIRLAGYPHLKLIEGILFFLVLTIIAAQSPVQLPRGGIMSMAFAVGYACIIIYGPAVAAWVAVLSTPWLLRKSVWYRITFNAGQYVLTEGLAGLVYQWAGGEFVALSPDPLSLRHSGAAIILSGLTYALINSFAVAIALALHEKRRLLGTWRVGFGWMGPRYLALAPFGVLMAMVYQLQQLRYVGVALFLLPLFWARYAFKGYMDMREVHQQTVEALTKALEAYDAYTEDHSDHVSELAEKLAVRLGFPETRMEALLFAARLHDIGKFVMEPVLNKQEKLNEDDWALIKQHPAEGQRIVAAIEVQPGAASIVRATHERPDGSGYPDGLRGGQIDLAASIIAVADAYHAMTSDRAYRRAMPEHSAIAELARGAGTQFESNVVQALIELWQQGELPQPQRRDHAASA
ncbi:MAG TPA: HD domain-containing phosphohydrolase [Armatimonadota bacterium]|nr:HD domain-containing phosphohydrolase [Armatimonadota bacterium]